VLIAKFGPLVSRSVNVTKPMEQENVDDLEQLGGRNADR
jgi:hypothetical protein